MSNTQNEDSRRRRRGLVAGALGISLLLGGTFALWSKSADLTGGTITNGNLDVAAVGSVSYYDVSTDRGNDEKTAEPITGTNSHAISDLSAYNIVPGDIIQSDYQFAIALEGDNLVADVSGALPATSSAATGVSFTAKAYYLKGTTWTAVSGDTTWTALTAGSATAVDLGKVQAANQGAGNDLLYPVITQTTLGSSPTANVAIVVRGTFDQATSGQTSVLGTSSLGKVTTTVTQVRAS